MQKQPRGAVVALVLALAASPAVLGAQDPVAEPSPAAQFAAIKAEFDKAMQEFQAAYGAAKTDAEREVAFKKYPKGETFAGRVKAIALKHPTDPVAAEAIVWVLEQGSGGPEGDELLDQLVAHNLDSPQLAEACKAMQYQPTPKAPQFLRAVMQQSKLQEAQGWACYALAKMLDDEAGLSARLQRGDDKDFIGWLTKSRGADRVEQMRHADPAALRKESEALLEQVVSKYGELKSYRQTLGEQAKGDLFELRYLAIGKPAPEIEGTDIDGVAFKLSDYRGKVVFLDFWGYW